MRTFHPTLPLAALSLLGMSCSGDPSASESPFDNRDSFETTGGGTSEASGGATGGTSGNLNPGSGAGTGAAPSDDPPIDDLPSDSTVTLLIEEDTAGFCSLDGVIESKQLGFTGTGYANSTNTPEAFIEWQVQAPAAAQVSLTWRYASVTSRPAQILVNKESLSELQFPSTEDWNEWFVATTDLTLPAGTSTIRLEATGAEGLANIDSLTIEGVQVAVSPCASEPEPGVDPNKKVRIYLVGDSTVMDYSVRSDYLTNYYPQAGWGEMLQELLTPENMSTINHVVVAGSAEVVNWAMGGRSTRSFWEEGRWQQVQDLLEPDDYVFIQFGHNDGASCSDYPDRCTPIPEFKTFLEKYVDTSRDKGAFPVLITPLNRDYPWSGGKITNVHGDYPAAMIEIARKKHTPLIDGTQRSLNLFKAKGEAFTTQNYFMVFAAGAFPNYKVTSTYPQGSPANDRTHLQLGGARAIAQLVLEGLQDLVEVSVTVDPPSCGSVDGAGWYERPYTPSVSLSASATSGCTFERWSGAVNSTSNTVSVPTDHNRSLVAHFVANQ